MTNKPDISVLLPDEATIAARRRALETEVSTERRSRVVLSPRLLAVATVMLALGGGAAWAAGVFSAKEVAVGAGVGCYEGPSLHASAAIFRSAADPVAKCARLWREGVLGGKKNAAPHLVACSGEGEPVFVFPGRDDLCGQLGLQPLPADYAAPGREVARAYTAWDRILMRRIHVKPGLCQSPRVLAERARTLLANAGYSDVPVRISNDGPCAKAFEARGRAIEVTTAAVHEARIEATGNRAFAVLSNLFERASLECIDPDKFGVLARRALRRAGLGQVRVAVSQRMFPCTYGSGGFSPEKLQVEIGASDRKTWRFNRRGSLRYQRQMRR